MEGPRPLRPEEFDSLLELVNAVFSSARGHMRDLFPLLFDSRNWENLYVSVDNGRVVSHVGMHLDEILILGCRLTAASIGAVATYDEYRGRGLATACLDAAEAKAISHGASVTYISGARGLYQRFGAVKVGRSCVYRFPSAAPSPGIFVREATADDVLVMERLYEAEPVRFHRPLGDWQATFNATLDRHSSGFQDYVYVAGASGGSGAVSGYVVVRVSAWDGAPRARVTEYAGAREHIIAALPAIAAAIGAREICLNAPDYDHALCRAAAATGVAPSGGTPSGGTPPGGTPPGGTPPGGTPPGGTPPGGTPPGGTPSGGTPSGGTPSGGTPSTDFLTSHTVKISCLHSFISSVKPLIEERLGRNGAGALAFQPGLADTYHLIIGEEHIPFSIPAFTTLVFGSPRPDAPDNAGPGAALLARLFPIPLPLPGLNYV